MTRENPHFDIMKRNLDADVSETLDKVRRNIDDAVSSTIRDYEKVMKDNIDNLQIDELLPALKIALDKQSESTQTGLAELQKKVTKINDELKKVKITANEAGKAHNLKDSVDELTKSINDFETAIKERKEKVDTAATNVGKLAVKSIFGIFGL